MISTSKKSGSSEAAWWGVLVCSLIGLAWLYFVGTGTDNSYPTIFRRILWQQPEGSETVLGSALATTAAVVIAAQVLSFFIGIIIGALQLSRVWALRFIGAVYVETVRGIPIYVMLLFVYFGVRAATGTNDLLTPFRSAVIALGVCYGAYMAEVVRAGFLAIPVEEIEAAALEARSFQVLLYIILPQALRTILPALANECIALLKDSAIVGVVTLVDITRAAGMYSGSTFEYFEAYLALALIYLALSLVLSRIQRLLEHYFGDAKAHRH